MDAWLGNLSERATQWMRTSTQRTNDYFERLEKNPSMDSGQSQDMSMMRDRLEQHLKPDLERAVDKLRETVKGLDQ
jgi:uncharacterized FlaG/YvyC family protein